MAKAKGTVSKSSVAKKTSADKKVGTPKRPPAAKKTRRRQSQGLLSNDPVLVNFAFRFGEQMAHTVDPVQAHYSEGASAALGTLSFESLSPAQFHAVMGADALGLLVNGDGGARIDSLATAPGVVCIFQSETTGSGTGQHKALSSADFPSITLEQLMLVLSPE